MRLLALLVVLATCWSFGRGLRIDKKTGAYEDIVVAIDKSVEPDERIIDNIKALFRSASTFLHRATRGLVHFGSVTIAIPDTWPARPRALNTTANMFPVADVRVAAPNPQYGDTPYTLQPRGCGERGEYVHLTPRFLSDMNGSIAEAYRSPEYLLVHEWAHFRYGVFDEYGDPESYRYPSLYCEFGMVRASTCSQRHKFTVYTDSGEPCRIYKGCRVSSKCKSRFLRNDKDPVTSSIMFMPYINGVTDFCDKDGDKVHNAYAPNKHNHLCERKSVWEVISANDDFEGIAPADPSRNVDVEFTEVQKREGILGRLIFALDISGSMSGYNRIGHLKEAASHYIRYVLPNGLETGLVVFAYSANKIAPLTSINETTREELDAKVQQLYASGGTCIGCALRLALQMFQENGQSAAGSVIILMTDGEENASPYINDVLNELINAQVVVNTIAFGTNAAQKLEELALRTGGKAFALRDGESSATNLVSAFLDSTTAMMDDDKKPVVICEQAAKIVDRQEFSILVDADLGDSTTVAVQSSMTSGLDAELRYPDGKTCQGCLESGPAKSGSYINFRIPGVATPGTWTLVVSQKTPGGAAADVYVRATSLAGKRGTEPVLARAFLKQTEVNSATEAVIYAEVTKGAQVVLHAKVTATVIRPKMPYEVDVELFDDGLGADVTANDGIYSAYFAQFDGVGRYSVSARVVSGKDSVVVRGRKASGGLPAPRLAEYPATAAATALVNEAEGIPFDQFVYVDQDIEEAEPQVVLSEKAPEFVRHAEGGSFRVANNIDTLKIPPGSIQDLSADDSFVGEDGEHVVILTWTCPGAHLSYGNASRVELRVSTLLNSLLADFDKAFEIRDNSTERGHITAGAVGSRQRLRISVPSELVAVAKNQSLVDFYFAARVWNVEGLSSPVSNIARITFERPPPPAEPKNGLPTWALIALIAAGAVVVVVVVAAVAYWVRNRRRSAV
ncbi:calcium-activated chloride channel regulator 3A-1 [Rhipicephalus sanguineus]|uniref:calcium-activated chloride channel regulator 3A-1 n=1 Tax=Rhipicephalus sanguineus TaxID=34632 RepID=UPI0020C2D8C1|nr:calcium-activated chloride channel regulator 3A-1 [Rhipicephalus sanguineus]